MGTKCIKWIAWSEFSVPNRSQFQIFSSPGYRFWVPTFRTYLECIKWSYSLMKFFKKIGDFEKIYVKLTAIFQCRSLNWLDLLCSIFDRKVICWSVFYRLYAKYWVWNMITAFYACIANCQAQPKIFPCEWLPMVTKVFLVIICYYK